MKGKQLVRKVANFKAADRPRKKEKGYQVRTNFFRKTGMVTFWSLFGLMLLVVFVNLVFSEENEADVLGPEPENPATSAEAVEFAKKFSAEYFTWNPENWEEREERLAPLLASGLDEQAGLLLADQEWTSNAGHIRLKKITEDGPDRALITLAVAQHLSKEDEKKTNEHTFTVPVGFAQAYGVYDLPSFTAVAEEHQVERAQLEGERATSETVGNIENFLATFFQSYTTDAPDTLAYLLTDSNISVGLEGAVVFEEIRDVHVVMDGENQYRVSANVVLREEDTGIGYVAAYRVTVVEENGRYAVSKLNEGVE